MWVKLTTRTLVTSKKSHEHLQVILLMIFSIGSYILDYSVDIIPKVSNNKVL